VLDGGDVLISAPTAGGKTEAAFLPLASRLASRPATRGFGILYLSPLKALINDQHRRLEPLFEAVDLPVHRWHGDVSADAKAKARKNPSGLVLITPESLEALFVRRGREVKGMFQALDAIVVDELHAFIGSERGIQLMSLLARLEACTGRRIDRIGLSATLGDLSLAAEALRLGEGDKVRRIEGQGEAALRVQVRGYWRDRVVPGADDDQQGIWKRQIADHLFETLRLGKNLVFANSRDNVEEVTDLLRTRTDQERLPEAFYAHHGNLSREHREFVEARLKDETRPATAVCTSTLELGIDIGAIDAIAQVGPPYTVSSLRQRLGRSGRRPGKPAVIRFYIDELRPDAQAGLLQRLNLNLVQSIAMVRLLTQKWCEPPLAGGLHLSTLTQQTLAVIAERGGATAGALYDQLCRRGPFHEVRPELYADLLRALARPETELIEQAPDGLILLGRIGERIVDHFDFYAVFISPDEYQVRHDSRNIGRLTMDRPRAPGDLILLAGRRWRIETVDEPAKVITVTPSSAALKPGFIGEAGGVHGKVAAEMRQVLASDEPYAFMDATAAEMLHLARDAYAQFRGSGSVQTAFEGSALYLAPWVGHRSLQTLAGGLRLAGIDAGVAEMMIRVADPPGQAAHALRRLVESPPAANDVASQLSPLINQKYHPYLTGELLIADAARAMIDLDGFGALAQASLAAVGDANHATARTALELREEE
jgi:ATP-dependent Lhr-like helicase